MARRMGLCVLEGVRQNSFWELSALLRRECGLSKSHMRTVRAPAVSELLRESL